MNWLMPVAAYNQHNHSTQQFKENFGLNESAKCAGFLCYTKTIEFTKLAASSKLLGENMKSTLFKSAHFHMWTGSCTSFSFIRTHTLLAQSWLADNGVSQVLLFKLTVR